MINKHWLAQVIENATPAILFIAIAAVLITIIIADPTLPRDILGK